MAGGAGRSEAVDNYILQFNPDVMQIFIALRDVIFEVEPEINEIMKWRHPVYQMRTKVFHMYGGRDHVKLSFFNGAELDDPGQLLKGTGKKHKHLKIYNLDELTSKPIQELLRTAVDHDLQNN